MKQKMKEAWVGFILFILGFPVLWFNEQRQAKMEMLFGKAAKIARVDVDSEKVDSANERCLVHMQGQTHSDEQLRDEVLGATMKVMNCAHLSTNTEMLQWTESCEEQEEDDNWGGKKITKTYSYSKSFMGYQVDSGTFNDPSYSNPSPPCGLGLRKQTAMKVTFGAFTLPEGLVNKLCSWTNCSSDAVLPEGSSGREMPPSQEYQGSLPPELTKPLAAGFINALQQEYVQGANGAVGSFFDSCNGPDDAMQFLDRTESELRTSGDIPGAIEALSAEWGLSAGSSGQLASPMSSGTGLRIMGDHLCTGTGDDVGDLRITFEKVPCGPATLLAVQSGNSFEPMAYAAEVSSDGKVAAASGLQEPLTGSQNVGINIDEEGESIGCCAACQLVGAAIESNEHVFEIHEAHMTAKDTLQSAADSQKCCHTILRLVGWLMMVFGLNMVFEPFPTLFRFIPFLGIYVSYLIGWIISAISFLLASSLALVTVSLAWCYARPARAAKYLLIAAALFACIYMVARAASSSSEDHF